MSINEGENAEKEGLVSGVSDHADIAAQDKVFLVDYCKRGITKCKGCGKNIPKDELRIGKSVKFKDKYIYQYLHCTHNVHSTLSKKSGLPQMLSPAWMI